MNPSFATRWNQGAIDDAYGRWQADPKSVDETWRAFFEGFALAERTDDRDARAGRGAARGEREDEENAARNADPHPAKRT